MKTWLITGASRGLGLERVRAALASGDQVIATARTTADLHRLWPEGHDRLLVLPMEVTDDDAVASAVDQGLARFGVIDVLVNNAGYGLFGAFEEASTEAIARQFSVNVFGTFAVTRAVLPGMRHQRQGRIITIASMAALTGLDNASLYCSSKYAVAGWSESLTAELSRFGIMATVVYPGMFRTDFLDATSIQFGDVPIVDYAPISETACQNRVSRNHRQLGDPAAFGRVLVALARAASPPTGLVVGSDAFDRTARKAGDMIAVSQDWRDLS